MKELNTYLTSVETASKFPCELGLAGGFINFRNSGIRGGVKEFTVSLPSILNGLHDIKNNIEAFSNLTTYVEKEWRDAGAEYFKDLVLNSMITVQTKPCFTTLSKIINWANNKNHTEFKDNEIDLSSSALDQAIFHVEKLIVKYTPTPSKLVDGDDNKLTTTKIRDFAFRIVDLLFKEHHSEMALLMHPNEASRKLDLPFLPQVIMPSDTELQATDLSTGVAETLRFFATPLLIDSKFIYISTQWYGDNRSGLSFGSLKLFLTKHFPQYNIIKEGNQYKLLLATSNNTIDSLLSKPFILLAGISGTGKTRFVRKQAEYTDPNKGNYQLISVRPDWHEPSDLLGYISRLNSKGAEFVVTDVVKFMVKAWLSTLDHIEKTDVDGKDVYTTVYKNASEVNPYWLCLDEMNLAPVEQYFADYLSVLETRQWEDGQYSCDALLSKNIFSQLKEYGLNNLRKDLGLNGNTFDDEWEYFQQSGICIPFNLIVAGTVNMDETTHGFSRKVIDRALTFDFGEFFPNDYNSYFEPKSQPKALGFSDVSIITKASQLANVEADSDGSLSIKFLEQVNSLLKGTAFELAFRALNELLVSVYCFSPKTTAELQAVWDDFLMCKVLPRIEGDEDKLTVDDQNVLVDLDKLLEEQFTEIWTGNEARLDLLSETIEGKNEVFVSCRSRAKLKQMQQKLNTAGFTSYWP